MIWCSENRDFFMAPSGDGLPEVSSFGLYYFKGGLHIHTNVSYRGIEARF